MSAGQGEHASALGLTWETTPTVRVMMMPCNTTFTTEDRGEEDRAHSLLWTVKEDTGVMWVCEDKVRMEWR